MLMFPAGSQHLLIGRSDLSSSPGSASFSLVKEVTCVQSFDFCTVPYGCDLNPDLWTRR